MSLHLSMQPTVSVQINPQTFPESTQTLEEVDLSVRLHGPVVATSDSLQVHLGLEAHFYHIRWLSYGNGHRPCGAAGQDPNTYVRVCRQNEFA